LVEEDVHLVLPLILVEVVVAGQGAFGGLGEDHVLCLPLSHVIPRHHALYKQLPELFDDLEPVLVNVLKLLLHYDVLIIDHLKAQISHRYYGVILVNCFNH